MKMNCTFPGCKASLELNQARVPAIAAIRSVVGRSVAVADLAVYALCGRHAHMVRKEGGDQTFSYVGTVALLERREAERETARNHFLHLRAKTQMGQAIAKAFTPKNAGPGQPKSQPSQSRQTQSS